MHTPKYYIYNRISVDGGSTQVLVDKIQLYTTQVHVSDGRVIILSNPTILPLSIFNYTRSLPYTLSTQIHVDINTDPFTLIAFKKALKAYLDAESPPWDVRGTKVTTFTILYYIILYYIYVLYLLLYLYLLMSVNLLFL